MLTPAAVLLLALLAAVAAVAWVYRRGGVSLHLADDPDLSGLLRGALERPEAFARVGALQARRLVPLVGGGRVSLARARRLAGRALFRGCDGDGLAARAARRGVVVVDCGRPEGRVVADGLGAVDLDHWQALLDGSVAWAAAEPVESALARYGVAVRVRLGGGLGAPLGSLEVARLGLRVVLVDSEGSLCRQVEAAGPSQPALAALLLADAVARHLELSPALRGRVLGAFARAALAEEGRR